MDSPSFAQLLRQHRLTRGLTQAELAERASLSGRAISDLERGLKHAPRMSTVRLLVRGLGLPETEAAVLVQAARPFPGVTVTPEREPVEQLADVTTDGLLVGRHGELARILRMWEAVLHGKGRMLLLAGEPGIGKTRLAEEAITRIQAAHGVALVGRCFEQQSSIPFFPFSEALAAASKVASPDLVRDATRWPELRVILPDQLLPPGSARPTVDNDMTQLRVFQRAHQFLVALAEIQPTVLLLDDLQWADATSLGLVLYLARHLSDSPLFMIGTYRDVDVGRNEPVDECLRNLARERVVEEVHLLGLDQDSTGALVRARLGELTSNELIQKVHHSTGGNPFFAHELLKALLQQHAAADQALSVETIEIPRSVRSVIGGRVATLPRRAREMLGLASVLGQEFDLELVAAIVRSDEGVFFDAVDAALATGLIRALGADHPERYTFSHALVQQTVYGEIPIHRRRRLHS
jgi:predicted ATPase/DNA-binding XRE family transcriptional regulator